MRLPPIRTVWPAFEREAQVLASLNHPHIAQIYGVEESAGFRALIMELVDGRTLDERYVNTIVPIARSKEAWSIGRCGLGFGMATGIRDSGSGIRD